MYFLKMFPVLCLMSVIEFGYGWFSLPCVQRSYISISSALLED